MSAVVTALGGTYRKGRTIDSVVDVLLDEAARLGAKTEKIYLLDKKIEFCTNCRSCTQNPGPDRGICVHNDDMAEILEKIDKSTAIVLASPINFYMVTALMKRFIERLIVYGYWPWGKLPKSRLKAKNKKAVLITSTGAPAIMARLFFCGALKPLTSAAKIMGAQIAANIHLGLAAQNQQVAASKKHLQKVRKTAHLLVD